MRNVAVLVDDDWDDLDLLSDCITEVDDSIRCICFSDPVEAMSYFARAAVAPRYIFLDLNMQKVTGGELLGKIRSTRRFEQAIVSMYSTSMPSESSAEFIRRGADFALAKPNGYRKYADDLRKIFAAVRVPAHTEN